MKKLTALALILVSAPPIQGSDKKKDREQQEEDRGLFDVVCAAVPYALSAGALYFCYQLQQRVGTLEAQIKKIDKVDKIDGLERQVADVESKSATKADYEALIKRVGTNPPPLTAVEPPSRPDSRNTDDPAVMVSGNPSPRNTSEQGGQKS